MNIIYLLPNHLVYNSTKNDFEKIENEFVVKYLKLIYTNEVDFQNVFLSKIEPIPDLKTLVEELASCFKTSETLTGNELSNLTDWQMKNYAAQFNNRKKVGTQEKSFLKNYVAKVKAYLDQMESEPNAFLTDEKEENSKLINTIENFKVQSEESNVKLTIPNITSLIIDDTIKKLECKNQCNIKNITLNDNLEELIFNGNRIEAITLNKKLKILEIAGNKLKELTCNEALEHAFVTNNELVTITCNERLQELICNGNQLSEINPNTALKELHAMCNNVKSFACNDELRILNLKGNPLKHIKLNKNLTLLEVDYSTELVLDNSIENTKVEIRYAIVGVE